MTYDKGNRLTIWKNQYLTTQKNFTYDTNGMKKGAKQERH